MHFLVLEDCFEFFDVRAVFVDFVSARTHAELHNYDRIEQWNGSVMVEMWEKTGNFEWK